MVGRKRVEPTCCVFELKLKYPAELEKNVLFLTVKGTTAVIRDTMLDK